MADLRRSYRAIMPTPYFSSRSQMPIQEQYRRMNGVKEPISANDAYTAYVLRTKNTYQFALSQPMTLFNPWDEL